jgi:hypothetical protein
LRGLERFSANFSERHLDWGGVLPTETLVTLLIAQSAALLLHVDDVWHSPNASHLGMDALGVSAQVGLSRISPEIRIVREVRCGSGCVARTGSILILGNTVLRRKENQR